MNRDDWQVARERMVEQQLKRRGIRHPGVLHAMQEVPREVFLPPRLQPLAYEDRAVPIACDQTISQPYIVALMTEAVCCQQPTKVLEVGTGCGYQAAVLSRLVEQVESIEIVPELYEQATKRLSELGCDNVHTHLGDGWEGWPEAAPYDGILVAAAPAEVPPALLEQLAPGGRLVIPVGTTSQTLRIYERDQQGGIHQQSISPVAFVPMTGQAQHGLD